MSLPTIEVQTHELTLPSANVQVKYRPFLVKEEKVLLQALENNDDKGINRAIKEIVHACTFGQIDGGKIPTFDLEYIFLNIRAKSIGEVAKVRLLCPDDKKTYGEAQIDLTKVEVEVDDNHTNKIMIDENRVVLSDLFKPSMICPKYLIEFFYIPWFDNFSWWRLMQTNGLAQKFTISEKPIVLALL